MWKIDLKKNQKKIMQWGLLVTIIIFISTATGLYLINTGNYSWENDPNRLEMPESVYNITVQIDFNNGSAIVNFTSVNLTNHYTTAFDAINKCATIEYRMDTVGDVKFYVESINGLREDRTTSTDGWTFYVNNTYSYQACNAVALSNNTIIYWRYSRG